MKIFKKTSFAKEEDFSIMQINDEKGLILGKQENDKTKTLRCLSPLSTLVIAPRGSGKNAGIIIPNLLSIPNSCVVIDFQGELYKKSAEYRQKHFGHKIIRFSSSLKEKFDISFSDYEQLRKEKITIYLNVDFDENVENFNYQVHLIKTFIENLLENLMKNEEKNSDNFIYFFFDEFTHFINNSLLIKNIPFYQNYGIIPVYIAQSYKQIKKYLDRIDFDTLLSNVGYQVIFKIKESDEAKFLSQMKDNIISSEEILNLSNNEILIFVKDFENPIKAKANYYFENPSFTNQ